MSQPFNDPLIRDWLFDSVQISGNYALVLTEGFIPFAQEDMDDFLRNHSFLVFNLTSQSRLSGKTVIVGQAGWSGNQLQNLIAERVGQTLKVYSQEMFLSYLLTGNDPFNGSRELLDRFSEGHPALEYLSELGFDWPSTFVSGGGDTELYEADWPKVGLLKHMGYKVGNGGIKKVKQRQKILKKVYVSSDLPVVKSRSYMDEWGKAKSCKRLQKMANSLATFYKNARRRHDPPTLAICHWKTDLDWIHEEFYRGHCSFSWPSTYVD